MGRVDVEVVENRREVGGLENGTFSVSVRPKPRVS